MNNFKRISAVILAICTAATVFVSCGNNNSTTVETSVITEFITEKETVEVEVTDEKGNVSVSVSEKIVTVPVTKTVTINNKEKTTKAASDGKSDESVITQASVAVTKKDSVATTVKPPVTTKKTDTKTTKKAEIRTTVPTTKRPVVDDKINEKAVGLFLLSKTDPVQTGNHATIFIQGTPGKTYSIDFYETPSSTAKIEDAKADANGFVSWSFEITNACSPGKRKVIIKEKDSDNYIETSITVE